MAMVPIIDLGLEGTERRRRDRLIANLTAAYRDLGFAHVVGHGVPAAVVDGVFAASRAFHALPLDRKLAIELDERHRGFIPLAMSTDRTSSVAEVTTPNQSESFMTMREDPLDGAEVAAGTYLAGPNQWPELPGFRAAIEAYDRAMVALGRWLVDLFATALGDVGGVLRQATATPTTWLRLLRFPPDAPDAPADRYGSAPHRDFGCITILAQATSVGSQCASPTVGGSTSNRSPTRSSSTSATCSTAGATAVSAPPRIG